MALEDPLALDGLRQLAVHALKQCVEGVDASNRNAKFPLLGNQLSSMRASPVPQDELLLDFAARMQLDDFELAALALCLAAEDDPHIARLIARAQDPVGTSRPVLGLLATLFCDLGATPLALANGNLVLTGIVKIGDERVALPERSLILSPGIAAALAGHALPPEGLTELDVSIVPLPENQINALHACLAWSRDQANKHIVVLRSPSEMEGNGLAGWLAKALGQAIVPVPSDKIGICGAWFNASGALPMLRYKAAPGERIQLPQINPYQGLVIVQSGPNGSLSTDIPYREIEFATPDEDIRAQLWVAHGFDPDTAALAASAYRQGPARIAQLAIQSQAVGGDFQSAAWDRLKSVVRSSQSELDGFARRSFAEVEKEELVLPEKALAELDLLVGRIRHRNRLADNLGAGIARRYSPGVRALFTGDSGTGKTLAAHWLSVQSGLPLYRVDQAVLTSKWIGETEKNLSAVLDAAQNADVLLFFDEADALFGARTDVSDAHDRYANAQTNYLLQRIEDYQGVIIMATNSRERFDPAFVRRIDTILAFPMPDAAARFQLWQLHLGDGHALSDSEIGRIASAIDLSGGHIRNIVLSASVRAVQKAGLLCWDDIVDAAAEEFSKLGRSRPDFGR